MCHESSDERNANRGSSPLPSIQKNLAHKGVKWALILLQSAFVNFRENYLPLRQCQIHNDNTRAVAISRLSLMCTNTNRFDHSKKSMWVDDQKGLRLCGIKAGNGKGDGNGNGTEGSLREKRKTKGKSHVSLIAHVTHCTCHSLHMSLMGKNYVCLSLWLRLLMGYSWHGITCFQCMQDAPKYA